MILPTYQPLGSSSHLLAQRIGVLHHEKATHTGTLDPMAEGVLIVLTGEDRFKKSIYSKWPKVYRFSILWGISTDTDDSAGILQPMKFDQLSEFHKRRKDTLPSILHSFLGTQTQKIHPFSARRAKGRSSFNFATENTPLPDSFREISISNLKHLEDSQLSLQTVRQEFMQRLQLLPENWRYEAIQESWRPLWEASSAMHTLPLTWFELHCSHGTYVRQLARDVSTQLDFPGVVWNLQRIKNGEYSVKDCKKYV